MFSIIFISDVSAQAEIFGFGGYMTFSSVVVKEGDLEFNDVADYCPGTDIQPQQGISVELLWISAKSHLRLDEYPSGFTRDLFD